LWVNPKTVAAIGIGVGLGLVVAMAIAVSVLSRYTDCGPGGNLISITGGHAVESRTGIQQISDQQYYGFLACNGQHTWLESFVAAGAATVVQGAMLAVRLGR